MKKNLRYFMTLLLMMVASVGWAQEDANWSYTVVNGDKSKLNTENKTFTVDESHVWNYEVTPVGESPAITIGSYSSTYAIKFGESKSKYFNPVILSTTAFEDNAVTKVKLHVKHNGSKVGTLTVTQGDVTIGTATTEQTSNWIDVECSETNKGSGGILSIKYEVDQALYVNKIEVWYEDGGSTAPSINAQNVDLAYDATSGAIAYTITNSVTGTSLTANVPEGSWLTLGEVSNNSIPFTCSANDGAERTETVTLTYGEITKDVTITQAAKPVAYTTIPAILEAATETSTPVTITFDNWVVSGVNGNQVFVTDGTNGFIIYQKEHGFVVGNTLSGTASCNLVLFNGSAELTGLTSKSEGLTVGENGSSTPVTTTIGALSAVNTGSVVTLSNLTYNGTDLTDGTNTITLYNSLYKAELVSGGKYNITGVFHLYNNDKRILPRSAEDIEVLSVPSSDDYAELPFVFEGGSADIAGTDGLTQDGLGKDYTSSPKLKFDGTGDYMILKINEAPSVLTFDIKGNSFSGGTFNVQTSADGENWSTLETYTELGETQSEAFSLDNSVRYIKWIYTEKVSGNVALGNIYAGEPESISMNEYGKATYVTTKALNFTDITAVTAYVATAQDGSDVTFDPVTKVPAGTPLLVKGTKNATVDVPVIATASATAPETNLLVAGPVASLASTTTEEGTTYYNFILNAAEDGTVGFYKANDKAVDANRAYLKLSVNPFTSPGSGAKVNLIFSDEEATGINNVNAVENTNEKIFNLAGQQMKSAVKGVYIKNGRKYVK